MHNLFAWKIATLIAICAWLWMTFIAIVPAPDWREGELYVAVPPSGLNVDAAFEMELAALFAQRMHLKIKAVPMNFDRVENALTAHTVHMAATGMRKSVSSVLRFSSSYQTLSEQIVCNDRTPGRIAEWITRNLAVVADSSQEEALRDIAGRLPDLHWEARRGQTVSTLLQEVAEGKLDCTVANEEQIALARNFYPELSNALDFNSPSHLAWAFPTDGDVTLFNAVQDFFEFIQKDGSLSHIIDRHYGHNERIEAMDAAAFLLKTQTVLPLYKPWFEEASALTGIKWGLLAALAYRESHWDPLATSFTNVRGMMMLTESTAESLNVTDRLDPHASILAGAKYLQLMKNSLPDRINNKERTWLALAAYNQGRAHLEDARILAIRSGLNPDVWSDVRKVMPLLSRAAYYEQAKHGQARGGEAVILVETVRLYQDMLNHLTVDEKPRLPPTPYFGYWPSSPKMAGATTGK